jgi:hypothetical protein
LEGMRNSMKNIRTVGLTGRNLNPGSLKRNGLSRLTSQLRVVAMILWITADCTFVQDLSDIAIVHTQINGRSIKLLVNVCEVGVSRQLIRHDCETCSIHTTLQAQCAAHTPMLWFISCSHDSLNPGQSVPF